MISNSHRRIFLGSLGIVFGATSILAHQGISRTNLEAHIGALVTGELEKSPKLSPENKMTPLVTSKNVVTSNNVTTVTSMSPVKGAESPTTSNSPIQLTLTPGTTPQTIATPESLSPSPSPSHVPTISSQSPSVTPTTAPTQTGKININTANLVELQAITGVGPKIAQKIIDYRSAHGPFLKIEDIINVSGIGDVSFQKMKDKITI